MQILKRNDSYLEWDEYKQLADELEHYYFIYQTALQNIKNVLARLEAM